MADRLFKTPLRALDAAGDGVSGAKVYLYETGTSTPVTAYTDAGGGTAHPTPLVADGGGTFAELFVSGSAGVKVDVTDSLGTSLDGYPVDPVLPESSTATGASNVSFAPTTEIPETDVQAAIEAAALLLGVSSNDTTPAHLEDKLLVAGDGLSLSTQNDGANETRTITSAAATETAKGTVEKATTAEGTTPVADKFPDTVGVAAMIVERAHQTFNSGGQTITIAGLLTLAHGMASIVASSKLRLSLLLECTTAEYGYSIGDYTPVNVSTTLSGTGGDGVSFIWDATNIYARYGSNVPLQILNHTTGDRVQITPASWKLHIGAEVAV